MKRLAAAIQFAVNKHADQFDKETIVKIATELYGIIVDFDSIKKDPERKKFKKNLEDKIALGLAAKCFLNYKK